MGGIIRHSHYAYITIPKPRSSKDISINSKLKGKLNIVSKSQYAITTKAIKK